jgi:membrane associated rhomboid family serine protease
VFALPWRVVLTFTGGPLARSYRLRFGSPVTLLALSLIAVIVLQALGSATMRDSLIESLGFARSNGFAQLGLLTHWLVDLSSLVAFVNALYLMVAGARLQAEYGRIAPPLLFLAGAVLGVAVQLSFGRAPDVILGASGAVALWMGMASAPYALASPVDAWGTITINSMRLRVPYVVVVIAWFVHQGLALVVAEQGAGHEHAAALAEFGLGIVIGLAAGRVLRLIQPDPPSEAEPNRAEAVLPVTHAIEMLRKKPRLGVSMLQRILREDRTNLAACTALLDALWALGERDEVVEEGVMRIATMVRAGKTADAASVYRRMVQLKADQPLTSRFSAAIVGAVVEALAVARETALAIDLARQWCAAHTRDPDAWRVRELLADLQGRTVY